MYTAMETITWTDRQTLRPSNTVLRYESWNFNSGNYFFTNDTK